MEEHDEDKKKTFSLALKSFVEGLSSYVSTSDGQWAVKGFIDTYKNIYTISADTKIISKILEIHIFPQILKFAEQYGYKIILAEQQNYYPDITFEDSEETRFAVDFKTTYRNSNNENFCNGFTLGSHGEYFINRKSKKNIQFPYSSYAGHFCLGIIYDREKNENIDETKICGVDKLQSIVSVIKNFEFFVAEKWKIASDKSGSGNTANIGSICCIEDIYKEAGMFSKLGEKYFDEYWMNYKKINVPDAKGGSKKLSSLLEYIAYKNGDTSFIVPKRTNRKQK